MSALSASRTSTVLFLHARKRLGSGEQVIIKNKGGAHLEPIPFAQKISII